MKIFNSSKFLKIRFPLNWDEYCLFLKCQGMSNFGNVKTLIEDIFWEVGNRIWSIPKDVFIIEWTFFISKIISRTCIITLAERWEKKMYVIIRSDNSSEPYNLIGESDTNLLRKNKIHLRFFEFLKISNTCVKSSLGQIKEIYFPTNKWNVLSTLKFSYHSELFYLRFNSIYFKLRNLFDK